VEHDVIAPECKLEKVRFSKHYRTVEIGFRDPKSVTRAVNIWEYIQNYITLGEPDRILDA
jgi:hypothetical protein